MLEEWGIKNRVLIVSLLPTMIIAALLGVYFTSTRLTDLEQSLKDHGTALTIHVASSTEYGVFANNKKILDKILENSATDPDVIAITIYDKLGKKLSHIGPSIAIKYNANRDKSPLTIVNNEDKKSLVFVAPIMLRDVIIEDFADGINSPNRDITQSSINQKVIGWVNIELGKATTILKQYQALFTSGCILLFGLLVSGLFAKRLGRDVTSPIIKLTGAVGKIKDGEFATRVYTGASGELKILESGINSMANSLKIAHSEMQNNVDEATRELRQTLETIEIQNAELDIARKEALAASRVKSEFLANMSHEIRTPMNGILGFTQLLLKSHITSQQFDYLMTINQSANSLLQIINDILDFSKIEAGKLELDISEFNLLDCLEESITILAPLAHNKNLELVPIVYSDVPKKLITDSLRLRQIITNLANNAIKFTHSGSVVIRVMLDDDTEPSKAQIKQVKPIKTRASKNNSKYVKIRVTVSDTGIGLSDFEKNKLFKAFSQADNTMARKFGGTGLGLVISKKLVQKMDGEIGLETMRGEGSVFWFTFKAKISQSEIINETLPEHIFNKNILICEQHPITRLSIKYLLKNWGISAIDISDINLIPSYLDRHQIDLIIYGLNNITNYSDDLNLILHNIKSSAANSDITNLAVLANTSDQNIYDKILELGIIFCIGKPVLHKKLFENLLYSFDPNRSGSHSPSLPYHNTIEPSAALELSNINILAVDDNLSNLKLIETLIKSFNINVVTSSSGMDAIEKVKKTNFDLILMDIQMPTIDGIQATKIIKNYFFQSNLPVVPVIAVTAHAILGEHEKLLNLGMNDYLSKPINERELFDTICKWVNNKNEASTEFNNSQRLLSANNTFGLDANITEHFQPVDWDLSLKLVNNNEELAKELLSLLAMDLPESTLAINQAYETQNYDDLLHHVHKLHGSCCYVGVPLLKQSCYNLESIIRKSKDFADYKSCLLELNYQAESVLNEVEMV